jgi:hypothetical protein
MSWEEAVLRVFMLDPSTAVRVTMNDLREVQSPIVAEPWRYRGLGIWCRRVATMLDGRLVVAVEAPPASLAKRMHADGLST